MNVSIEVPTELAPIIESVIRHYQHAVSKHPEFPTCPIKQSALICEEAGEAIRESNNGNVGLMKHEVGQTCAVALRTLLNLKDV